jgi:hypothetical protein
VISDKSLITHHFIWLVLNKFFNRYLLFFLLFLLIKLFFLKEKFGYQLDFIIPGIFPARANILKQIRHISNFRRYPLRRPQIRHRLYLRTLNLGSRFCFIIKAFFAKTISLRCLLNRRTPQLVETSPRTSNVILNEVKNQASDFPKTLC